jgi:hypothetical protein
MGLTFWITLDQDAGKLDTYRMHSCIQAFSGFFRSNLSVWMVEAEGNRAALA